MAGKSICHKIIEQHLVAGKVIPGTEIGIRIDQTLTQDATGTMAYLQFEAMGIPRTRAGLSVSYVDHNMLQDGFENADDHRYLQSVARKFGVYFSRPGNGICHQVHRERFGVPGQTLLGSDSHTPTGGGMGMLAMGAGGLDVAVAMAGHPYYFPCPSVTLVRLSGRLRPWVGGKDIILELLRRLSVKGGVGRIMEYGGPGVDTLPVADRFTVANMGAELGATTSVFPSDELTRRYLQAQGRPEAWIPINADPDATYEAVVEIDLDELEPMIARPHSPDNVAPVRDLEGTPVQQVCIGSCTNSSYHDLRIAAAMLRGRTVSPAVSLTVTPGSRQVLEMIARNGSLADLISAGARVLEAACGPCIGNGQAPPSGANSVRSFNRNFEGRSGTRDAGVFLASPETCVACAITGVISDPRDLGIEYPEIPEPESYSRNDSMVIPPPATPEEVAVSRGPNIVSLGSFEAMADSLRGRVLIRVGDNITTDHIMPAGRWLKYRSNVPRYSEATFNLIDPDFPKRSREWGGGLIVAGENYGQGSSREHAALVPRWMGVKAVIAKSFARIHEANLVNFGILPLVFANPDEYDRVQQGDTIEISHARQAVENGLNVVEATNLTQGVKFGVKPNLTERGRKVVLAGGMLNYVRS
ncbi:MAG: 2,3-dimethylmalate dehydratase large subunit [Candidatus Latescibacteria bacterium ADurb.Bin168]|nr:MAG: 2,3-dimethylmalate dehydratase large subunit [Candidatus Latescibacteria bacterium ADurb.Bin168]